MKSRLVNVRLDEDRLQKVRVLRRKGVVLSDLVREAIDARFDAVAGGDSPVEARRMIEWLFEQYPDPPDLPVREYDVHDRRAAREAVRRKLSRGRR